MAWPTTPTIRPWIIDRIHEALHEANMARAAAEDLPDQVLVQATLRLAEALEAFTFSYADRLGEIDTPAGYLPPSSSLGSRRCSSGTE